MSQQVKIYKLNEVYAKIDAERSVLREIYEEFSFQVPNARFNPKVKNKIWDGYIRLLNLRDATFPIGLVPDLHKFLVKNDYEVIVDSALMVGDYFTPIDMERLLEALEVTLKPHDFQEEAVTRCISEGRALILSATGSGKSFIQFLVSSYYRASAKRTLLVVPSQNLVNQMYGDFQSYSPYEPVMQKIMGGYDKEIQEDTSVVITTWQSIYKEDQEWFDQFEVVMVDEVHYADAASLKGIMEKCVNIKYRFGFTGTLKDSKTNQMVLVGMFGPVFTASTTKELMDRKILTPIHIRPIIFKHDDEIVKKLKQYYKQNKKKFDYQEELKYIISSEKRNSKVALLAKSLGGNTLILFDRVETHGKLMYDVLCKKFGEDKIYFIHGKVDVDDREEVRKIMEKNEGVICVASSRIFSTGVNIRNLHNIILSSLGKSKIAIIQSIGRSVRLHDSKEHANLIDLSDDLRGGNKTPNYSLRHLEERMELYRRENFEIKPVKVVNL